MRTGRLLFRSLLAGGTAAVIAALAVPPVPVFQTTAATAPSLKVTATYPFQGTSGVPVYTVEFLQFSSSDGDSNTADFTARVEWGDGTSSPLTVVDTYPDQMAVISGMHTYARAAVYSATVHIHDVKNDARSSATVAGTITGIAGHGVAQTLSTQPCTVILAVLTDNDGANPTTGAATVAWGDGTPREKAVVVAISGGRYYLVGGCHTFAKAGIYMAKPRLADSQGSQATFSAKLTVTA